MRCSNCGKEVRDGSKYCNHCGAEIVVEEKLEKERKVLITAIVSALCLIVLIGVGYFTGLFDRLHITNRETMVTEAEFNYCMACNDQFIAAEQPFLDENGYVEKSGIPELLDTIESVVKGAEKEGEIDHYTRDENTVFVTFKSGLQYLYIPPVENVMAGGADGSIYLLEPSYGSFLVSTSEWMAEWDASHNDLGIQGKCNPESCADMIVGQYPNLYHIDKDTQHLKNEDVTLEAIKQINQHSVIIFEGHGGYNKESHSCLITGEYCSLYVDFRRHLSNLGIGVSPLEEGVCLTTGRNPLRAGGIGEVQFAVRSEFLDRYLGEMPNSVVFLGACYSMKDDMLAQTFLNHGASAVIGYSDSVSMEYEMLSRTYFFYTLTQEQHGDTPSVLQAVTNTKNRVGKTDAGYISSGGAELKILARDGDGSTVTLRSIMQSPSPTPTAEEATPEPTPETYNVFKQLPEEFVFTSGAGAWTTTIQVADDGSFTGQYHDWNPDTGTDYPNGSVYICDFRGRFSAPTKVSEYVYSTTLLSITQDRPTGEVYYQDGCRYLCSDPYGFDDANEFLIILPGGTISDLPDEFRGWSFINQEIETMPEGVYGLYNVSGKEGFTAIDEKSIWLNDYVYRNDNGARIELWPSYSTPTHVEFFPGDSAALFDQCFVWKNSDQTVFQASDWEKTTFSTITIRFSDDLSSATLSIDTDDLDLSLWGGTTDGKLTVQLVKK